MNVITFYISPYQTTGVGSSRGPAIGSCRMAGRARLHRATSRCAPLLVVLQTKHSGLF